MAPGAVHRPRRFPAPLVAVSPGLFQPCLADGMLGAMPDAMRRMFRGQIQRTCANALFDGNARHNRIFEDELVPAGSFRSLQVKSSLTPSGKLPLQSSRRKRCTSILVAPLGAGWALIWKSSFSVQPPVRTVTFIPASVVSAAMISASGAEFSHRIRCAQQNTGTHYHTLLCSHRPAFLRTIVLIQPIDRTKELTQNQNSSARAQFSAAKMKT